MKTTFFALVLLVGIGAASADGKLLLGWCRLVTLVMLGLTSGCTATSWLECGHQSSDRFLTLSVQLPAPVCLVLCRWRSLWSQSCASGLLDLLLTFRLHYVTDPAFT